jgi:hypothetical protein
MSGTMMLQHIKHELKLTLPCLLIEQSSCKDSWQVPSDLLLSASVSAKRVLVPNPERFVHVNIVG